VAFSGGGVRGLAHLGVLQVLEEARIPVDLLAGTSMGGIVAGVYAAGVPLEKVIEFSTKVGLMDLAARDRRWLGLFGHAKMGKLLADLLGSEDITFEDLQIPTAVVAVDVETGEMVILDRGPLIPALMATSAFPILFSPVHYVDKLTDHWLVDGGVVNNFPVDIVRRMGADRVLGVTVPSVIAMPLQEEDEEPGDESYRRDACGTHSTGGHGAPPRRGARLSPRALFAFSSRTMDWKMPFLIAEASVGFTAQIVSQMRLSHCPPDLVLEVSLPNVGLFATDKNAAVIEAGRREAMSHLAELVALYARPLPPRWRRRLVGLARRFRRAWAAFKEPAYLVFPGEHACRP
jgi:NTE family protein